MKPVLTVEGKGIEIYALFYRDSKVHSVTVIDDNGVSKTYHDVNENTQYYTEKPLQIDFNKCLKWDGQHDDVVAALEKRIESYEEHLQELANEFISIYNDGNLPFPGIEAEAVQKEHRELMNKLEGLYETKRIVLVELEGGEEDVRTLED